MSANLFSTEEKAARPLADRVRPKIFDDVVGQAHLLDDGSLFKTAILSAKKGDSKTFPSVIFWGPTGCGKTTVARLIADNVKAEFISISAITHATADLKEYFKQAEARHKDGRRTIMLVDEIHRFNRAQQDLFLPFIENGTIILVGATTENPSFELNGALLSRCKVIVLNRLNHDDLLLLMQRAEQEIGRNLPLDDKAKATLAAIADGDGRYLLNLCEELFSVDKKELNTQQLLELIQKRAPQYDKSRDGHYNLISALHKSLRGSDPQAGLYWFYRMIDGGEDPLYIVRRLIRFASEDIGMADPNALVQAITAKQAYEVLGSPEGELNIAQAVVYLATAPKSNALYSATKIALKNARETGSLTPPKEILNAPTKLMKDEDYGTGYIYDHDTEHGFSGQNYFPDEINRQEFYQPKERGFERDIKKRIDYWEKLRNKKI